MPRPRLHGIGRPAHRCSVARVKARRPVILFWVVSAPASAGFGWWATNGEDYPRRAGDLLLIVFCGVLLFFAVVAGINAIRAARRNKNRRRWGAFPWRIGNGDVGCLVVGGIVGVIYRVSVTPSTWAAAGFCPFGLLIYASAARALFPHSIRNIRFRLLELSRIEAIAAIIAGAVLSVLARSSGYGFFGLLIAGAIGVYAIQLVRMGLDFLAARPAWLRRSAALSVAVAPSEVEAGGTAQVTVVTLRQVNEIPRVELRLRVKCAVGSAFKTGESIVASATLDENGDRTYTGALRVPDETEAPVSSDAHSVVFSWVIRALPRRRWFEEFSEMPLVICGRPGMVDLPELPALSATTQIVATASLSRITGRILSATGGPIAGYTMSLIRWTEVDGGDVTEDFLIKAGRSTADGQFSFGVPNMAQQSPTAEWSQARVAWIVRAEREADGERLECEVTLVRSPQRQPA
jgi:hypothetical protein